MEGEGLGESRVWRQVDVRVDVRRGGGGKGVPSEESQGLYCNILSKNLRLWHSKRQCQYSSLFDRLEADQSKACELQWSGTAPLMSTWRHARDFSPRPSPSVFAYCKRSKTGSGNGLGTSLVLCCVQCVLASFPGSPHVQWKVLRT